MSISEQLRKLSDEKNAAFQAKLTPGIEREKFLGVRVPDARKLAKKIMKEYKKEEVDAFLNDLPHFYYDENMLHGLLISEQKDYAKCIERLDAFLPYVDNWAVCDIMSPVVFKKHKDALLEKIKEWIGNPHVYTCRFAIEMLMSHYLDDAFNSDYLKMVAGVKSDEYYVNMMIAWYFATALAKQWDATVIYIEEKRLDAWTHNKTIQKARESLRITNEQKEYLNGLKIKG